MDSVSALYFRLDEKVRPNNVMQLDADLRKLSGSDRDWIERDIHPCDDIHGFLFIDVDSSLLAENHPTQRVHSTHLEDCLRRRSK